MKLSEAIRLGSTLGPQIRRQYIINRTASCALGAAMLAIGKTSVECASVVLEAFPILRRRTRFLTGAIVDFGWAIVFLNDHYHWTREQIADFVEEVEREAEREAALPQAEEQTEEVCV